MNTFSFFWDKGGKGLRQECFTGSVQEGEWALLQKASSSNATSSNFPRKCSKQVGNDVREQKIREKQNEENSVGVV